MPDSPPPPAPQLLLPAKRKRHYSERRWVPALTIRLETGERIKVPTDLTANRAANQILAAKTRAVIDRQLDLISRSNTPLDPVAMKDLVVALTRLTELTNASYATVPGPDAGRGDPATSDIGKMAAQMVGAAAKGLAAGASDQLLERMKRIDELGRRAKPVIEVKVEAVKP